MKMSKGMIFYSCLLLVCITVDARRFPIGCNNTGYSFNYNTVQIETGENNSQQTMYFVHNVAKQPITLYQMRTGEEPYVIHINNSIEAKQWAVYATDESLSRFICTVPSNQSRYGSIVNCSDVLEICQYTNAVFAPNGFGNYWAVSSMELSDAQAEVIAQGDLLK